MMHTKRSHKLINQNTGMLTWLHLGFSSNKKATFFIRNLCFFASGANIVWG